MDGVTRMAAAASSISTRPHRGWHGAAQSAGLIGTPATVPDWIPREGRLTRSGKCTYPPPLDTWGSQIRAGSTRIGATAFADLLLHILANAAVFIYCWTPGIKTASAGRDGWRLRAARGACRIRVLAMSVSQTEHDLGGALVRGKRARARPPAWRHRPGRELSGR